MNTASTSDVLVVSGPPGSGRTFTARRLAPDDATLLDASGVRSTRELVELVRRAADASPRPHTLIVDDAPAGADLTALAPLAGDGLTIVVTTLARTEGARTTDALDDAAALALFERHAHDSGGDTDLVRMLRRHPLAIETAARRAAVSSEAMRAEPWESMLWGASSALQASYEREWERLAPEERAILEACAILGDHACEAHALPWLDVDPSHVDALHRTHWFERPWVLEHGARHFVARTRDLEALSSRLGAWVADRTIAMTAAFRLDGSPDTLAEFESLWPLTERTLERGWVPARTRADMLAYGWALMTNAIGFVRFDAYVVEALEHDLSLEQRLLLDAYHHTYASDRGAREAALESFERGARSLDAWSEPWREANFVSCRGSLLTRSGDHSGLTLIEDALARMTAAGHRSCVMMLALNLARLELFARRHDDALSHIDLALDVATHDRMGLHVHICQAWKGSILTLRDENEPAARVLEDALEGLAGHFPAIETLCRGNLSMALMNLHRFDEALEVFSQERERALLADNIFNTPKLSVDMAYCHHALGEHEVARGVLDDAIIGLEALPYSGHHFEAYALRVAELVREGDDPSMWVSRCESHPEASSAISIEFVRALARGEPLEPRNVWERILSREMPARVTLDVTARTLHVGGTSHVLVRRPIAFRLLVALARAEAPMDAWSLVEIGWPDSVANHSALTRLYTTIRRMRELGLDAHIVTTSEGYTLEGVRLVEEA